MENNKIIFPKKADQKSISTPAGNLKAAFLKNIEKFGSAYLKDNQLFAFLLENVDIKHWIC